MTFLERIKQRAQESVKRGQELRAQREQQVAPKIERPVTIQREQRPFVIQPPQPSQIPQFIRGLQPKKLIQDIRTRTEVPQFIRERTEIKRRVPTEEEKQRVAQGKDFLRRGHQLFKDITGGTENERLLAKQARGERLTQEEQMTLAMNVGGGLGPTVLANISRKAAKAGAQKVSRAVEKNLLPTIEEIKDRVARRIGQRITPETPAIHREVEPPRADRIIETQPTQPFLQSLREKARQLRDDIEAEPLGKQTTEITRPQARLEELTPAGQKKVASDILYPKQELNKYLQRKNLFSRFMTGFKEKAVVDWERVKQLSDDPNLPIPEEALTPFQRRKLYFGRTQARLQNLDKEARSVLTDYANISKQAGVPDTQIRQEVHDYLLARHAPERNLALKNPRAAGITNEEAAVIIQRIEGLPHAEKVKEMAQRIRNLDSQVLDTLYQGGRPEGVIDKELYDLLRKKYKEHVPLHRIFDDDENIIQILGGRGLDVRGTGILRAKGSERPISDITENVFANYTQAIQRVQKNIVDNETLRFARQFNEQYPELNLFEISRPKAVGRTFSGEGLIFEQATDPRVLHLREAGKATQLKINDPRLAVAMRGISREKLPSYLQFIGSFTRFTASLLTRRNPVFPPFNKIRDLQESLVYIALRKDLGVKDAVRTLRNEPQSFKSIFEWLRGVDTPGARLYEQMRLDGGTTGGLALSTREQLADSFKNIEQEIRSNGFRKVGTRVLRGLDDYNQLFEDSTRLSAYMTAINKGFSREKAALLAKEVSLDFNQLGTMGPVVNALYMFSNASIQGSYRMLKAMKENPKMAAAITIGIGSSVFAINIWNDRTVPGWRNKVTDWDRASSFVIMLPSENDKVNYITIPISWALRPIITSINQAYDLATGQTEDIGGAFEGIVTSVLEGYNPLGEQNIIGALSPTITDIPLQVLRNQAWHGGRIKPEGAPYSPESELYFRSLKDTMLGRGLVGATSGVYEKTEGRIDVSPADLNYAILQYIGGAGRFVSQTINTISSIGKGEVPETREVPFLSRILKQRDIEETGVGTPVAQDIGRILEIQERNRIQTRRRARTLWEELKKIPTEEEYNQRWQKIVDEDEALAEKIKDIAEEQELGLTHTDRLIKDLGVRNQERARYLYSYLMSLPDEQYEATWQEFVDKKIITEEVAEQLKSLFNKQ